MILPIYVNISSLSRRARLALRHETTTARLRKWVLREVALPRDKRQVHRNRKIAEEARSAALDKDLSSVLKHRSWRTRASAELPRLIDIPFKGVYPTSHKIHIISPRQSRNPRATSAPARDLGTRRPRACSGRPHVFSRRQHKNDREKSESRIRRQTKHETCTPAK